MRSLKKHPIYVRSKACHSIIEFNRQTFLLLLQDPQLPDDLASGMRVYLKELATLDAVRKVRRQTKSVIRRAKAQQQIRRIERKLKSLDPYPQLSGRQVRVQGFHRLIERIRREQPHWTIKEIVYSLESGHSEKMAEGHLVKSTDPSTFLHCYQLPKNSNLYKIVSKTISMSRKKPTQ